MRRAVSSSVRGARLICCVFRAFAPKPGCCSYSSGRAVQSSSSGTPSDQSARCSRKESSASSAQCRSSKTSTVSRPSAHDSSTRRQAVNDSSCAAGSPPAPTSGARRALSQAKSGSAAGKRLLELRLRLLLRVGLEDPALRLDDLAERPERDPVPVGKAAPLAPAGETRSLFEVVEELGAEAALARARLADDRHQLAGALLRRPLEGADQERLLELTPDEWRRVGAGDVRAEAGPRGERAKERERLGLPLDVDRLELLVVEDALGCR